MMPSTYPVREALSPHCVDAVYCAQVLPQYRDNPLIEALPASLEEDALVQSLSASAPFEPEQRTLSRGERLQMLKTLQDFMVPLARHIELATSLDAMVRQGYVGRAPNTPSHAKKFQQIYELQQKGQAFRQSQGHAASQLSALLLGISGMGKTTTVKRTLARFPRVIYHPQLGVYQVPYLHVEMPSDGSSIKGLAHGVLRQMDTLIPGANYYETYAIKGRPGADAMMRSVARVMHAHYVGLLVADEVQNLANSSKGGQTVMTELVSACNELGIPILFIGTNKASKVFSLDFRQARRASGHSIAHWDRLQEFESDGSAGDEWAAVLEQMWQYQWVSHPVELDAQFSAVMYNCSQGVVDIAIKLFASAQARAILDGTERLTQELIEDVYRKELALLHPMLDVLRKGDLERLAAFDDIAPVNLTHAIDTATTRLRASQGKKFAIKRSDPTFESRVAASLVSAGVDEDIATFAAAAAKADRSITNLVDGTRAAHAIATHPRAVKTRGKGSRAGAPEEPRKFEASDYRNAALIAERGGISVVDALRSMGASRPLNELLQF